MNAAALVSVALAGILTGNELGTWVVIHPALARLDLPSEVAAEKEITRRYGFVMPALMIGTAVAAFLAAGTVAEGVGSTPGRCLLGAGAAYTVMIAITLIGNVPLNMATLRTQPDVDRQAWRQIRRRWDRFHLVRIILDVGGLVAVGLAVTLYG